MGPSAPEEPTDRPGFALLRTDTTKRMSGGVLRISEERSRGEIISLGGRGGGEEEQGESALPAEPRPMTAVPQRRVRGRGGAQSVHGLPGSSRRRRYMQGVCFLRPFDEDIKQRALENLHVCCSAQRSVTDSNGPKPATPWRANLTWIVSFLVCVLLIKIEYICWLQYQSL